MIENLEKALKKRFPREDVRPIAEILSAAARKGRIVYDELEMQEDSREDLLLLLVGERLLLPVRTSRALAWEDRLMTFGSGEAYNMPNVIRHLIANAEETGEWSPDRAVRGYLGEIGETEPDRILSLFHRVRENAVHNRISPEVIMEACGGLNLTAEAGRIIAELKGGDIISPCLRDPSLLRYEINPSLIERDDPDCP